MLKDQVVRTYLTVYCLRCQCPVTSPPSRQGWRTPSISFSFSFPARASTPYSRLLPMRLVSDIFAKQQHLGNNIGRFQTLLCHQHSFQSSTTHFVFRTFSAQSRQDPVVIANSETLRHITDTQPSRACGCALHTGKEQVIWKPTLGRTNRDCDDELRPLQR